MAIQFENKKYAQLGPVTMHFTTGPSITRDIQSLGVTTFEGNESSPVSFTALGQEFYTSALPTDFTYPNGDPGTMSMSTDPEGRSDIIIFCDIY
jgi:hypothetical protein